MARLRANAPDHQSKRLAGRLRSAFGEIVRLARQSHGDRLGGKNARTAVDDYLIASYSLLRHLDADCGGHGRSRTAVASIAALYSEQQGHHGVNTFTNYHNASGLGPRIDPGAWVQVSCKVYDPYIQSVNPDGYWYRIASAPWNDAYYSPANTFMNGDPWNGPYTHNTDFNVPDCGAAPPPPPGPSAALAQGPAAPAGYRYSITVDHFAANSTVSVSCRDSVSPNGFYTFSLATDASGHGFTQSYCDSGDGPDHWIVVNGSIQSNHVTWTGGAAGGGSTGNGDGNTGGGNSGGGGTPSTPTSDTCLTYSGSRIADSGSVAASLFLHYIEGLGDPVVIDWSYFSRNASFVAEAKSLQIGHLVSGWAPPKNTDMYAGLGHFTIERDTADCYLVYDRYDFDPSYGKAYLVFFPLWAIQIFGARTYDVHASGKLQ